VIQSLGDRSLKAQLKQANSIGASKAVIIGEDEAKSGTVVLRDMGKGEQTTLQRDEVVETLKKA
jgi:histidyl-tRNA synthetase